MAQIRPKTGHSPKRIHFFTVLSQFGDSLLLQLLNICKFTCEIRLWNEIFQSGCVRCRSLNELTERIYFVVGNHFSLSLGAFFSFACFLCAKLFHSTFIRSPSLSIVIVVVVVAIISPFTFLLLSHCSTIYAFLRHSLVLRSLSHTYTTSRHSFHTHLEFYSLLDFKWIFVDDGMT